MRPKKILATTTLLIASALSASGAIAQSYEITQWTLSAGGTTQATGGDWRLSGTIGQWEATPARALSGGPWRLTGGFWAAELSELGDLIFRDQFKRTNSGPPSSQQDQSRGQ